MEGGLHLLHDAQAASANCAGEPFSYTRILQTYLYKFTQYFESAHAFARSTLSAPSTLG